jgi:hypothetical protein
MPWWSWIVIWVGLVVLMLVMFVLLGWWLARKGMLVISELDDLMAKADALAATAEELRPDPRVNALLRDYDEVAAEHQRRRADRATVKDQHRRERIRRGKLLIRSTPSKEN